MSGWGAPAAESPWRYGAAMCEIDMTSPCFGQPPEELLKAVDEFNRCDWFACHESLEELWVGSVGEMRDFYQGLLQFAVALHHWREGNFRGAVLLLSKAAELLRRVPPVCQRVEVGPTVPAAERLREELMALGPERMEDLAPDLIPVLRLAPE
jgi:uncharacterized protein